jgi:hypothetical protein
MLEGNLSYSYLTRHNVVHAFFLSRMKISLCTLLRRQNGSVFVTFDKVGFPHSRREGVITVTFTNTAREVIGARTRCVSWCTFVLIILTCTNTKSHFTFTDIINRYLLVIMLGQIDLRPILLGADMTFQNVHFIIALKNPEDYI